MTPDTLTLALLLVTPFIFNAAYAVRLALR
jgi:hypothetical protein